MHGKSKVIFEEVGAVEIGDVRFEPVTEKDKMTALCDDFPTVTLDTDKNSKAFYDVFNKDRTEFLGHLNMFYDRGGYLNFIENRQKADGSFENVHRLCLQENCLVRLIFQKRDRL